MTIAYSHYVFAVWCSGIESVQSGNLIDGKIWKNGDWRESKRGKKGCLAGKQKEKKRERKR